MRKNRSSQSFFISLVGRTLDARLHCMLTLAIRAQNARSGSQPEPFCQSGCILTGSRLDPASGPIACLSLALERGKREAVRDGGELTAGCQLFGAEDAGKDAPDGGHQ